MSYYYDDDEIILHLPEAITKEKPVLYLPNGREVTLHQPLGFARHPLVPRLKEDHR